MSCGCEIHDLVFRRGGADIRMDFAEQRLCCPVAAVALFTRKGARWSTVVGKSTQRKDFSAAILGRAAAAEYREKAGIQNMGLQGRENIHGENQLVTGEETLYTSRLTQQESGAPAHRFERGGLFCEGRDSSWGTQVIQTLYTRRLEVGDH